MSRSRAYHGDRPYADLVVFKDGGKWCVRLAGKQVGPYPSKARALSAAIDTARLAESAGKSAQVLEQTGPADFKMHWPKPVKPRPIPPKSDKPHREPC
jgi:hypothetical protein